MESQIDSASEFFTLELLFLPWREFFVTAIDLDTKKLNPLKSRRSFAASRGEFRIPLQRDTMTNNEQVDHHCPLRFAP